MPAIHPTAHIHPGAELDPEVEVGPFCSIGDKVKLGPGSVLMANVVLHGPAEFGPENIFFPHCVGGTDPQDLKYRGEDTSLRVGKGNTFREFVTLNRGTKKGGGITVIGDGNLFMACSHVAHDCHIGNNVVMANNVLLAGHITISDDSVISGAAAIHHFTTVGRAAFVGGLTRIVRDVPPFMIVEGNPARVRGVNAIKLERLGMDETAIRSLKEAYRSLWKSDNKFSEALEEIENKADATDEVKELALFLRRTDSGEHGRALESTRRP
jgi:UDP-N-acetylglucosamine acyltransferase